MGKLTSLAVLRPAFASLLLAVLGTLLVGQSASAQTDVSLSVPAGIIVVEGKASPNAQVKIYENGNDQPAASVIADSAGNFSEGLPQMATNVVDISILAIDTNGVESVLITKQVAVIYQQTSTLTVILPPTITVSPETIPFGSGTIEFSGRTIPGASVKVTIEPSTILTTTADSQGNYMIPLLVQSLNSVGVYTYGVEVTAGDETSDYVTAGTFVISPPVVLPPVVPPNTPFRDIVNRLPVRLPGSPISVPEITSPIESEITSSDPFVISGQAPPGSEVTIYDGGEVIGVVIVGEDGTWQFYFSPYKETHTVYARACQNGRCSENSRTLIVKRPTTNTQACKPGVFLNEYRLNTVTGKETQLLGNFPQGQSGIVVISWGDTNDERFDIPPGGQLKAAHTYREAGIYSGYIIVNNGGTCQTATYFAVAVTNPAQPMPLLVITVVIITATIAAGVTAARLVPRLRR